MMQTKPTLIIVYLFHSLSDMGSLGKSTNITKYENLITKYWVDVVRFLKCIPNIPELKVYSDGLPDTSEEAVAKIIEETRTPHFENLSYLKEQGATIIGTENPDLLREEYENFGRIINNENKNGILKDTLQNYAIIAKRDAYIAQRIRQTLKSGETGLLLIGNAHNIKILLEEDVQIQEAEIPSRKDLEGAIGSGNIEGE